MNNAKDSRDTEFLGVITIKSIFSKEQKLRVQPTKDPQTGWYYGLEKLSEEDKKKKTFYVEPKSFLIIRHGHTFDMSKEIDRINWGWVKWCPAIAMSFGECQMTPGATFYVENEEREAKSNLDRDTVVMKAMQYVMQDSQSNYAGRIRLMGFNMDHDTPLVMKEFLMGYARKFETAQKVISIYESNVLAIQLLYLKARDKNLIKVVNGAYIMGDTPIGISEEAAIDYLKDPANRQVVLQLEKDLNPGLHPEKKQQTSAASSAGKLDIDLGDNAEEGNEGKPENTNSEQPAAKPKSKPGKQADKTASEGNDQ